LELSKLEKHSLLLGKLVGNFQSLEFALRAFLINDDINKKGPLPKSETDMHNMIIGDVVSENAFTNYDSLSQLINKYNCHPKIKTAGLSIDETLVDIRDAIAHGRVSSEKPLSNLALLKFDRPKNGKVEVVFNAKMTEEWFKEQIKRAYEAVIRASEANEKLQSGEL